MFSDLMEKLEDDWAESDKALLKLTFTAGALVLIYIWLNVEFWVLAWHLNAVHLVICALLISAVLMKADFIFHALVFAGSVGVFAIALSTVSMYGTNFSMQAALAEKTSASIFVSILFGLALRLWRGIKS